MLLVIANISFAFAGDPVNLPSPQTLNRNPAVAANTDGKQLLGGGVTGSENPSNIQAFSVSLN